MRPSEPVLGIDLGSRTTKLVRFKASRIESFEVFDTNHDALGRIEESLRGQKFAAVVATGYGRHLLKAHFSDRAVTEIRACARGAQFIYPSCGMVIDIGGQDSKAIQVRAAGGFGDFEMNDRCAAGTGRFLEVMAALLGYEIEEFWREALATEDAVSISSMCTVFAESEVISLITSGVDRRSIALGLHHSIADRLYGLISRVDSAGPVMLVGGVANNKCIVKLLEKRLKTDLMVPANSQIVSAVGCALIAEEGIERGQELLRGE